MTRPNATVPAKQSARREDPAQSPGTNSSSQGTVIVWDHNQERLSLISKLVESCGSTPRIIERASDVDNFECLFRQSVALIALGAFLAHETTSLSVIRSLKLKGFKVISYEDDILSWPIGKRCQALLSGSLRLLDSASKTFSQEFVQALTGMLAKEANRHFEDQRIKEQMKDLGLIGESSQMMSVFQWVIRVSALSDFPVLITGETGTGKELIANAIHSLDAKRRKGPFIAANCSAISAGLAESELFGHRRGAFTGADSERKGLFRSAEGGVLFLDEISELSESLQAKLLRVLQEERVLGVGFDREVPIDVRVIAATNKNLEEMVRQGRFREDLYHRLDVLSVDIPPLRERYEDLRPLVEHFLRKYSSLNQSGIGAVNSDFVEALRRVELSGNARQLENIVRRALLNKVDDTPLCLSDLTPVVWEQLSDEINLPINRIADANSTGTSSSLKHESQLNLQPGFLDILDSNGWNLAKSLEHCERLLLKCALQFARGNQSQTARLIGITPRSVYNKVHKHKLNH